MAHAWPTFSDDLTIKREERMRQWRRLAGGFLLFAVAAMVNIGAVVNASAADAPTLELGPAELVLGPGEQAEVIVVVRNTGVTTAIVDTFDAGAVSGLTLVLPDPSALRPIAPGSAASTVLKVVSDAGFLGGSVSIQAIGRAGDASFAATAGLKLTIREPDPGLTVTLVGVPDSLSDGEAQAVQVQVTNPSAHVWSDVTLQATGNESLCWVESTEVTCPAGNTPLTLKVADSIQPGGLIQKELVVRAQDRVRAGSQTVSVVATAGHKSAPLTQSVGSAEATIKVTIFGIDLLSPFGITSLFLIPGAFAALAFQFVRGLVMSRTGAVSGVDLKDPGALLFIIPISVLVYLGALVLLNRDLRSHAGTLDALGLFVVGLLIGLLIAGAWWLRWWWVVGRKTFTIKDLPLKVLTRLERRGASLAQPTITIAGTNLQLLGETDQRVVACQQITYEFGKNVASDRRGKFTRAVDGRDLETVIAEVRAKTVTIKWLDKEKPGVVDAAVATVTRTNSTHGLLKRWSH
jgi:hypothetical protein